MNHPRAIRSLIRARATRLNRDVAQLALEATFLTECLTRGGPYEAAVRALARRAADVAAQAATLRGMRDIADLYEPLMEES